MEGVMEYLKECKKVLITLFLTIVFVCAISEASYAEETYAFGDNITGVLDDEGTLTITGSGAVYEYDNSVEGSMCPIWSNRKCYSVKNVVIDAELTNFDWDILVGCVYVKEIRVTGKTKTIYYEMFKKAPMRKLVLEEGVEVIEDDALEYCDWLTEIELPSTLKSIGNGAFCYCTSLTAIDIPDSVETIGAYAFDDCSSIDIIIIPRSVKSIGIGAFRGCSSLSEITFSNPYVKMGDFGWNTLYLFKECPEDMKVHLYKGSQVDELLKSYDWGELIYDLPITEAMNVEYRTKAEIIEYLKNNPVDWDKMTEYLEEPYLEEPYSAGVLTEDFKNSTLRTVNAIRYIAGIGEVELNKEYSLQAQTAAFVSGVNGYISTSTSWMPTGISGEMIDLAASGCANSNLASGFKNFNNAIVKGFMNDGQESNIEQLIHRRRILNPDMKYTGFGAVTVENKNYYVMYANDNQGETDKNGVAWPAQTMPIEYFGVDYPWSFSLGTEVNENLVKVKLTNKSTGEIWNFSAEEADGDFFVSNDEYGRVGCVIFRPDGIEKYCDGDEYLVEISDFGKIDWEESVSYSVRFFELGEKGSDTEEKNVVVGEEVSDDVVTNGTCKIGDDVYVTLRGNVLTISGTGDMYDYDELSPLSDTICGMEEGNVEVVIEKGVTSIGACVFAGCVGIKSVVIGEDVESIGSFAFYNCYRITEINIPSRVKNIDVNPFADCYSIEKIVVDGKNTYFDSRNDCNAIIETSTNKLVSGCKNTSIVHGMKVIGERSFQGCTGLGEISIPDSVIGIESGAFMGCDNVNILSMSTKLESVGWAAFYKCSSLKKIIFPDTVSEIDTYMLFYECTNLEEVVLPRATTIIDYGAFNGCNALKMINIPEGVTEIGQYGFYHCVNLQEVELPESLETIGIFAFYYCCSLKEINIPENVKNIYICPYNLNSPFWNCYNLEKIVVDSNNPYYDSRNDCNAIIVTATNVLITGCNNTVIPSDVVEIQAHAFESCRSLKELVIPKSVTKIGLDALKECIALEKLVNNSDVEINLLEVRERFNGYNWYEEDTDQVITKLKSGQAAVYKKLFIYGDANGDDKINVMDAVLMKKHIAGFENLTINLDACDVNVDTRINVMDAVMVLKYIAGFDVDLGE